jgi:hypothetical protein
MSEQPAPQRIHVVVGAPWMDAVIKFLEPASPYSPWPPVPDARGGDGLVVIFDSAPRLVVAEVGHIDGDIDAAIANMHSRHAVPAADVGLQSLTQRYTLLERGSASALLSALQACQPDTAMTAARILLRSDGICDGCNGSLELSNADARDAVAISITDWPAALCAECQHTMRDNGFHSVVDYRFSQHPVCPQCGGRRTQRAMFGLLPYDAVVPPWRDARGCCVTGDIWTCTLCAHQW